MDNIFAGLSKKQILLILMMAYKCSTLISPLDMKKIYNISYDRNFSEFLKDLCYKIDNNEIMNIDNDYFYSKVLNNLENELINEEK